MPGCSGSLPTSVPGVGEVVLSRCICVTNGKYSFHTRAPTHTCQARDSQALEFLFSAPLRSSPPPPVPSPFYLADTGNVSKHKLYFLDVYALQMVNIASVPVPQPTPVRISTDPNLIQTYSRCYFAMRLATTFVVSPTRPRATSRHSALPVQL
jgi:hypothetical protein